MTSDRQKTVTCYSFARSRCPGPSTLVSSDIRPPSGHAGTPFRALAHPMYAKRPLIRMAGLLFACRTERRYDHSLQGVTTQTGVCDN